MYIADFFKRMGRKSNIATIIYLILNVVIIGFVMQLLFGQPFWAALLIGMALYLVSLAIALSPVGEWLLRKQTGCKPLKDPQQIAFFNPIFQEVYQKARAMDPSISKDVKLFISDEEEPNAFATGRKTVCITTGLSKLPPQYIKATLGHEFGHLAHKDTDLLLVVCIGNMIVNGFVLGLRLLLDLGHILATFLSGLIGGDEGWFMSAASHLNHVLMTAVIGGLTWVWTKIGVLLTMKSSRGNEFEADAFSSDLGYGDDLCALLDQISGHNPPGLYATLASSHPDKSDRIAKLRAKGATYMEMG